MEYWEVVDSAILGKEIYLSDSMVYSQINNIETKHAKQMCEGYHTSGNA